jgi:osmotically-inducible protein OsmY
MPQENHVLHEVKRALEADVHLDFVKHPVSMAYADGTLTLEGEVESVAEKKRALERAALVLGVDGIVDRLRVAPAQRMTDAEIRDHLCYAFVSDVAFAGDTIATLRPEGWTPLPGSPEDAPGKLMIEVRDGIVTLNGNLPSLEHKRLAGLLAWWVPGSRDVINGIAVEPPEEDGPDKIEEAVRVALEKDPLIDAGQVRVGVRNRTVHLTGALASDAERHMAESDAWYVFGVDQVFNDITVMPLRA